MSPAKPLKPSHSYSRYVGSPSRRIVITGSEAESISSRSNSDFYDASPPPRARSYLTPTSCGTREYSTSPEPPSVSCASGSGRSSPTPIPNHTKPRKGRRSPETSGSTVLVPWVEITNLEEVLADPEWRLIRRRYLEWKANKLVSRRHSKGKGKEKATVHILSDEEDEEEEAVEPSLEFANEPAYGSSFRRGVTPRRRPRKFDNYSLRPSPASERYTISSDDEEDVYQPSTDGRAPLGHTEVETGEESVLSPQYGHPSRSHSPPTKPAAKKRGRPKGFKSTAKPKNLQLKRTKFVVPSDDNSDQSTSDTIEHLAADEDVCSTFRPPQKTKGTRAVSMFSYRLPQRPHVVLKPAVIDSLPVRHCHMCHKKHVFMACDRCSSAWCDHCLSKCVRPPRLCCTGLICSSKGFLYPLILIPISGDVPNARPIASVQPVSDRLNPSACWRQVCSKWRYSRGSGVASHYPSFSGNYVPLRRGLFLPTTCTLGNQHNPKCCHLNRPLPLPRH